MPLADLGGVPGARPKGSRFFRFDIQNFRNVTALGVHVPPLQCGGIQKLDFFLIGRRLVRLRQILNVVKVGTATETNIN